ncbi:MAG TPA: hypothetical protein ENK15_08375 [Thermopetrobacter sp.]|nr:hypothetical protein [Thermopetrobacter sp.]
MSAAITRKSELAGRLGELPPALTQGLAVRAALRTVALLEPWLAADEEAAAPMLLPTLRALAVGHAAAVKLAAGGHVGALAALSDAGLTTAAVDEAVKHATKAVALATSVIVGTQAKNVFHIARIAFSASVRAAFCLCSNAAAGPDAALRAIMFIAEETKTFPAAAADCAAADAEDAAAWLAATPLWLGKEPRWSAEGWPAMKSRLLARDGEEWRVWTDWYEARRDPQAGDATALEVAVFRLDEMHWRNGPKEANPLLARFIG